MTPTPYLKNIPFALFILGSMTACQGQSEQSHSNLQPTISHNTSKEKTIVVPPNVNGSWKSVKIAVIDKTRATENIYTVPIGGKSRIPPSNLVIAAEAFLPSFVMEGSTMTSSSNELNNPGVKVNITDNGQTVFNGWLFARFPTTHAVTHPKFGFTLVGAVPAPK